MPMIGGGFEFKENRASEHSWRTPTKTGTTICGVVFSGGVVLGADTRSTNGETVADKNCEKIHFIAPNVYCCGAGTAADTESLTGLIASQLYLHRKRTDRQNMVTTALTLLKSTLFRYQGHIGAALVLGGVDNKGPHLFTVYPHGSSDALPYASMGSGSLAAISVLESGFNENMNVDDAKNLVASAIHAGIINDLGSGSCVDLCVITELETQYLRNYSCDVSRTFHHRQPYAFNSDDARTNTSNVSTATRT